MWIVEGYEVYVCNYGDDGISVLNVFYCYVYVCKDIVYGIGVVVYFDVVKDFIC